MSHLLPSTRPRSWRGATLTGRVARLLALLLATGTTTGAEAQSRCPEGAVDCQRSVAIFEGAGCDDLIGFDLDSGWLPDGPDEPLQVRFVARLGGLLDEDGHAASVTVPSDVVASWPEAITVGVEPRDGGGRARVAYGLDVRVLVRYDVEYRGIRVHGEREIPLPFLGDLDAFQMEGEAPYAGFDAGPITVRGASDRTTLFEYDVLGAVLSPIEVLGIEIDFGGGFRLDVQGYAEARFTPQGVGVSEAGATLDGEGSVRVEAPFADGFGPRQTFHVQPTGEMACEVGLSFLPSLFVELLDWSLEWDLPVDLDLRLDDTRGPARFADAEVTVALPDVVADREVIDLGAVPAGRPVEDVLIVRNDGDAALQIGVMPLSSAVTVSETAVTLAPGEDVFLVVGADLSRADSATAGLLLTTNDPDRDRIAIGLLGEAIAPPRGGPSPTDEGPGASSPEDTDPSDPGAAGDGGGPRAGASSLTGGCAASGGGRAPGAGWLALAGLLALRRRR